jgi:thioredoxin reductase/polyferredoxin
MGLKDILPVQFEFSSKIGVRDLPKVDARHQSNVKGLYVVGDLADAPIIKVALSQGHSVAERIWTEDLGSASGSADDVFDVVVVGAGPAGIGAGLFLQDAGARYVIVEKERPFATIQNFPKSKLIFSEPREMASPGNFWFEDATTEVLVERWDRALDEKSLNIEQPVAVTGVQKAAHGFDVHAADGSVRKARRVILATGRRGTVRRLEVPGAELDKVSYTLKNPAVYADQDVVVVGGGDSAVEAACDLADAGARVTLSYRKGELSRPKNKNKERIERYAKTGRVALALGSTVASITPDSVVLNDQGDSRAVDNHAVLVFIGTTLPYGFLEKLGIRLEGRIDALRALWIASFAAITWAFYVLKSGTYWDDAAGMHVAKRAYFPFGPDQVLGFVPDLLHVDLGFRTVDGSFWGTTAYSLLIVIFGIRAFRKYPSREQKKRYLSLMGFQAVFLFGIPELLAPFLIWIGGEGGVVWQIFGGDRAWKFYTISVPWPLNIWSLIDGKNWAPSALVAGLWLGVGALVSFVAIPLYVRKNGERFCSYLCGCGGLAETLGDFWRHLAPRGATSYKSEWVGRIIFALAIPVTVMICLDAWGLLHSNALLSARAFAETWYTLCVDFALASVLGVALYPYLGNRVWCRFFCPLRAYMEVLAKRFARLTIKSNDKCIGCGECTRFCQMGIDVQRYAQRQRDLDNSDSACIQCGICVQVCPMEVLSIGERGEPVTLSIMESIAPGQTR